MKTIVIGLGNFGVALAQQLTTMGIEVLGVDSDINKINAYKDTVKNTICLDMSNEQAAKTLPLKDTDIVFVALGKDVGASILSVAVLKENNVKRIVARSISELHRTILKAMGVTEIISPQKEYAEFFAIKIKLTSSIYSYLITDNYLVNEMQLPEAFIGRRLGDVKLEKDFSLKLIAIKRELTANGKFISKTELIDQPDDDFIIQANDIFILAGKQNSFIKLLQ